MVATYGTTGFTAIQFSDIHQNQNGELEKIVQFITDNSIDYGFFCGDAVGENHNFKNGVGLEHELLNVANNHNHYPNLDKKVEDTIKDTYKQIKPQFQAIKDALSKDLLGVLGNHDLTLAYDVLDSVTWLDRPTDQPVQITLANGKTLAIGGNQNTYENPGYHQTEFDSIRTFLEKHYIDYKMGYDSDKFLMQLKAIEAYEKDPMTLKIMNQAVYQQIKDLDDSGRLIVQKGIFNASYNSLEQAETKERQRLENKLKSADAAIFLTHKIANTVFDSGKITKEVTTYNNMKSTHGGHMHAGEMSIEGHGISISDVLALIYQDQEAIQRAESRRNGQANLQKTAQLLQGRVRTEDFNGEEIITIYIGNSTPEFNAGSGRFMIHKYDDNANWEFADLIEYSSLATHSTP